MFRMRFPFRRLWAGAGGPPAAASWQIDRLHGGGFRRRRSLWIEIAAGLAGCLISASAPAAAGGRVADHLLQAVRRGGSRRIAVIVQTQGAPTPADLRQVRRLGGRVDRIFRSLPGFSAALPPRAVNRLAARPRVRHLSPDQAVSACWDYNVETVGADVAAAEYGVDGRGIGVAVIDSGICPNADFDARVVAFQDFVLGLPTPYDDCGHGTHVAGILAGSGANSSPDTGSQIQFRGAAPGANLIVLKALDATGATTASRIIAAIDWCITNRQQYNLRVINLSLGHPVTESYQTDPLNAACQAAVRAGLVMVVAAGNHGKDALGNPVWGGIDCPANDPSVIAVGATNTMQTPSGADDRMTSYSSRGPTALDYLPKPDLVAPGNKIVSVLAPISFLAAAYPLNQVLPLSCGASYLLPRYFVLSGTSMAAPLVSGSVALMLQRNPGLSPNLVKAALMYSARRLDLGLSADLSRLTQGTGVLNVPGALEIAAKIRCGGPRGTPCLSAPLSGQSVQQGSSFPWAGEIIWGSQVLQGDLFSLSQDAWPVGVAWGDAVSWTGSPVWGDLPVSGDPAWETNVVWGDNAVWGDNVVWGDSQFQLDLPLLSQGD